MVKKKMQRNELAHRAVAQHDSTMHNQPLADASIVACPHCDLLQRLPEVAPGASARCPRCDKELWRHREDSLNRTFALSLAALVLYVVANTVPMLGLTAAGHAGFHHRGWRRPATLAATGSRLSPCWSSLPPSSPRRSRSVYAPDLDRLPGASIRPPGSGPLLRHLPFTRTWSMIEVMLIGVLVALTKIADYATVIPGVALFSLGALVFLLAAMQSNFDPREVWDRVEWADAARPAPAAGNPMAEVAP